MSQKGEIYDMAQWYPRMAVYDDLRGWDTLPYIGSEFYLEYGKFDYYITAPSEMLIVGIGELVIRQMSLPEPNRASDPGSQQRQNGLHSYGRRSKRAASRPKQGGT